MTDRTAGRAFVGRRRERDRLSLRLDEAASGRGGAVALVGEAGIGKTALASSFAEEARARGALVVWGRSFEGDWAPPLLPWVEALDTLARAVGPELVAAEAPLLARMLPALRATLPAAPAPTALGPEEERYRLHDACTGLLLRLAERRPLVVVLDDLHWADPDSLALLRHVGRFAGRGRLLVVVTYRDPDAAVDRHGGLAATLAVLTRESGLERLALTGLSYAEAAEYLAGADDVELPQAFVQAIHRETDGNPFFAGELFRHLVETGKIVQRPGGWSTDFSIPALGLPASVREVVGRRVLRLSGGAREMLRVCSALGGGFVLDVVADLVDLSEAASLDCLDEALAAGLIRPLDAQPPGYDFVHAIVRHALYDGLNPDRRTRLHRRIAEALARAAARHTSVRAGEIATQYHRSRGLPGAAAGLPFALAAADEARAAVALEQTAAFLRIARDLAEDGPIERRADVAQRLGLAEAEALLLDDAPGSVERALVLMDESGAAPPAAAGFLAVAARALKDGGAPAETWEPLARRGLALLGERRDLAWARLTVLLDRVETLARGPINVSRRLPADGRALALLRNEGDEDDKARAFDPFDWRNRAETERVLSLARSWASPTAQLRALDVVVRDFVHRHGAPAEGAHCARELLEVAARHGSIPAQVDALVQLGAVLCGRGDFDGARRTIGRAEELAQRLGPGHRLHVVLGTVVATELAIFLDGDWPRLAERAALFARGDAATRFPIGHLAAGLAAYAHTRAGQAEPARRLLASLTEALERLGPTDYQYPVTVFLAAATAWELPEPSTAPALRRLADGLVRSGVGASPFGPHELALARASALAGDLPAARRAFERARAQALAREQRALPPIVDHDEALALERARAPERAEIRRLAEASRARFEELGMASWAGRAAALVEAGRRPDGLTAREAEVLDLLAGGLTNREIADRLVLSVPTVERHVANLYGKIGARNRAEATAYTHRRRAAAT